MASEADISLTSLTHTHTRTRIHYIYITFIVPYILPTEMIFSDDILLGFFHFTAA